MGRLNVTIQHKVWAIIAMAVIVLSLDCYFNYSSLALSLIGLFFGVAVFIVFEFEFAAKRQMAEELKKARDFSALTLNAMDDIFYVLDLDGKFLLWNKRWEVVTGYNHDEITRMSATDFFEGDDVPRIIKAMEKAWQAGFVKVEAGYVTKDRRHIPYGFTASAMKDPAGRVIGLSGTGRDITERRRVEEALESSKEKAETANKAKGDFLANMSHEIRTPMNAILGFGELLKITDLSEKQKNYVEMINSSGQLLLKIIDDILDIAKLDSEWRELESVEFDLHSLTTNVFNIIDIRLMGSSVYPYVEISPDVPVRVKGDPTKLRQVLINLLGNAAKFTDKGEIGLLIDPSADVKTGEDEIAVRFIIKDTGIGVSEDKLESMFLPFVQADSSSTRKYGGTGLGLTIVKAFVEAMGGKITVQSRQGHGSEFTFVLVFKKAQASIAASGKPSEEEYLKGKKVFILDDNGIARRILRKNAEAAGLVVLASESTAEGAEKTLENLVREGLLPDVLLFDVILEKGDCFHLLEAIRKDERFSRCKIVAVTAEPRIVDHGSALRAGFDGYLAKPFAGRELAKVLTTVLENKRQDNSLPTGNLTREMTCRGAKVLLVEDSVANIELMKEYFDVLGCEVKYAYNGRQAVDMLRGDQSFELCFMDLQMPEMGGLEAAKIIRDELKSDIPIIALTAAVLREEREAAFQVGMNDFLAKPVQLEALHKAIQQYVLKDEPS
ncbi:MAG: response regulator [Candidatus Omnitrophica bacterium]|nr:response regulator [Candidatus Omnitrophota bacterium]